MIALAGPLKAGETRETDPRAVAMLVGGGVFIAGGIALLIVDHAHQHNHRWAVIAPKPNEFGIAYRF